MAQGILISGLKLAILSQISDNINLVRHQDRRIASGDDMNKASKINGFTE